MRSRPFILNRSSEVHRGQSESDVKVVLYVVDINEDFRRTWQADRLEVPMAVDAGHLAQLGALIVIVGTAARGSLDHGAVGDFREALGRPVGVREYAVVVLDVR